MATTETPYSLVRLEEAGATAAARGFGLATEDDAGRGRVYIRRDFDIGSFGVNAFFQAASGGVIVQEHDEVGPGGSGHEELYVVVQGGCAFTIGGEDVDAPQGTAIFVRDPATKRSARATRDDTIVVVTGGRPGETFRPSPGDALGGLGFYHSYRGGDHDAALAAARQALELHSGNPLILFNIACLENRLGNRAAALTALRESLDGWPEYKQLAQVDDDLASLRDDAEFLALID